MNRASWITVGFLAMLVACDRTPEVSPPSSNGQSQSVAATQPVTSTQPTTDPAQAVPTESFLSINDQLVAFPAARLRVDQDDDQFSAVLFSDDPPDAIDPDYDGNSYYIEFPLDIASIDDLGAAPPVIYRRDSSEYIDSPYGIFTDGRRWQLQPDELRVELEGGPDIAHVTLSGTFLMFDMEQTRALPTQVHVTGELVALVRRR